MPLRASYWPTDWSFVRGTGGGAPRGLKPQHRWQATASCRPPNWTVTRGVSIGAPRAAVWPWLVQMGYQRGGLYTYDRLDRWFGVLDRASADSVLTEFQGLAVGDIIPIRNDPGWPVAELERERVLVLDIRRPRVHITWSFLLTPEADGGTRLVLRYRGFLQPRVAELPLYLLLDVAEFLMSRRMLIGIRERAERLASRPTGK